MLKNNQERQTCNVNYVIILQLQVIGVIGKDTHGMEDGERLLASVVQLFRGGFVVVELVGQSHLGTQSAAQNQLEQHDIFQRIGSSAHQ